MKLNLGYFYPKELNLYGDTGNVEILVYRADARNIKLNVQFVDASTKVDSNLMKTFDIIFMGGGPDSGQKDMYKDLIQNKGPYIKDYINENGVALFICGSYQLMGHYYKPYSGPDIEGLGVYDMYTKHFGVTKNRCVGNVVVELDNALVKDPSFKSISKLGNTLVGFENHGGRTFLQSHENALANVISGYGNNGEDSTEGYMYKNSFGTYLHGPLLSKNPHFADYLLLKASKRDTLEPMDDKIIIQAHSALKNRFK